jgi:hypothetical protein
MRAETLKARSVSIGLNRMKGSYTPYTTRTIDIVHYRKGSHLVVTVKSKNAPKEAVPLFRKAVHKAKPRVCRSALALPGEARRPC